MAKAKYQVPKAKPNKLSEQNQKEKHGGKQNHAPELWALLDNLGLKIIRVTADGNCFFRALADQLEGDEDLHEKYRAMVVQFIKNNREMFEPFVEDDIPFDEYCKNMGEDGTWAGHMELQAASLVTHSNICIHRNLSPRWYIQNFDKHEARMIHVSYHDGEHYNSVRSKHDTCSGPARPITIKGDTETSVKQAQSKVSKRSPEKGGGYVIYGDSIKLVKAGTGCEDRHKVEQALLKVGGDIDTAIEVLIEEQGRSDHIAAYDELSDLVNSLYDSSLASQDVNSEQHVLKVEDKSLKQDLSSNDHKLHRVEKKLSRNKPCPCGSRLKYKACCGTVADKSSAKFPVYETVDYGKSRKERKQARKNGPTVANTTRSEEGLSDMGALCI